MLDAARQIRKVGGAETVRFHVLLHAAYTRVVPGMTRTALSLPPVAMPRGCGRGVKWHEFQKGVKGYFADCCV